MAREIAPLTTRAALLFNANLAPYYRTFMHQFGAAPAKLSIDLRESPVHSVDDVEPTIAALAAEGGAGLIVGPEPFTVVNRHLIIESAERHRLPVVYCYQRFVSEGALVSYGPDTIDIFRRAAAYVDRILKGEKPAELPAQSPIKFELAINVKTAKSLGLNVPATLLARADEVIE
jgi:putative ABC transport system substrate-binding protein